MLYFFFFFNDTATTEIYTLSLHDALPIYGGGAGGVSAHARDLAHCGQPLPARLHQERSAAAGRAARPHARERAGAAGARQRLKSANGFFWSDGCLGIISRGNDNGRKGSS